MAVTMLDAALTTNEALSGITGSISLAAWIFLLVPQLVENYKQGSADGISISFLAVWFIGDIANLAGAVWAGLVPTVIALAIYFCFADLVLIAQCLYYNIRNARRVRKVSEASTRDSVEQPLLGRRDSDNMGLPGSRRRSSAASRRRDSVGHRESLAGIAEEENGASEWKKNVLSILGVCLAGAVGWAVAWATGVWRPTPVDAGAGDEEIAPGAQVLGYASAICYLGARLPQIYKNWREQSCEGLSLLFFLLSLLGNLTYGMGILFHSVEKEYFLTNLPWLIGSLGTMVEDAAIFFQFRIYGDKSQQSAAV
ncbi:putative vacuolar membrane pq loop repeat protein [Lasiodiplodia theobromae]|uniref:Putative vacuolar amino acid transporter YPQ1 n=1 Tax=Lasiodiplodia theobromae TaxID=45133 RepID=A0A5N5D940_9PEZI|nr:Vacuolar membrane pq loop repeat protein [Lasiodiplodia theobromae]KAB2574323.1 putative vacuolar amino acid transporter YPQ1 [Lasiodiplodia theobromae]KAF4538142.1 Vacuolar membrane pq loop repeat protein [Lasiodiplodia theobromae]KAF9637209.1 putative vacuolar membrane pq loop repeat protein [Lasiodiplodia theobromae]